MAVSLVFCIGLQAGGFETPETTYAVNVTGLPDEGGTTVSMCLHYKTNNVKSATQHTATC